jgi:hypothetical protein
MIKEEVKMKKIIFAFVLVIVLMLTAVNLDAEASTVPKIFIQGVTQDKKVTILTQNFPANKEFIARMNVIGTKGVNGIVVGSVNSGVGGSLLFTFDIPAELHSLSQIAIRLDATTGGYYSYNWFYNKTAGSHAGGVPADEVTDIPMISVISVKEGAHVILKMINFPLDEEIDVLMGEYGTKGVDGTLVSSFKISGIDDAIMLFEIPESLKSETMIDIRLESQDSDLVLYTSFENTTGGSGGVVDPEDDYTGIPTFKIINVVAGKSVTILTNNFPEDHVFKVMMGKMWTQGVDGIYVTTVNSVDGGEFSLTFDIPAALASDYQISIRLESTSGGFYAYNWFYNNTATDVDVPSGYTGYPTFTISSVVKDKTVTIAGNNFPAGYDFQVLMGKMWTQGIGGYYVKTINSGDGGSFSATFDIPVELQGDYQISIRLAATSGGFYAYNWFYNVSYP